MKFFSVIALFLISLNLKAEPLKIGLVLDKGGKDDKSFNAAAFKGATEAAQKLGVEVKTVESPDDTSYERSLKNLSERGYKLLIAVGFAQTDAVKKIAPQFPKTHFAIVDGVVDLPNVTSLMFNEHEGSFLVGYIAGLKSKTNVIGFVGGMEVDLIKRFELGYKEGIALSNPKAKVLVNYAGVTSEAWMNPTKGKELALSQISQNADIIFTAAGATNTGVFDAIEEKNKFAIGVDSNQNWVKPGKILTSMLKRVDLAVFETIKAEKAGDFKAGKKSFGLADKGVDYALDKYNQSLISADLKSKIEKVKKDIASKKIIVSDYYETRKLCPNSPFKCEKYQKAMQALTPTKK
ncbi:MAG: BMP family ABC transporter substrate-binding protein [Oligoflexia bacterium]|nr:BMP family ABC transporter substrate-binding protein [Oligoflexia bacterium]